MGREQGVGRKGKRSVNGSGSREGRPGNSEIVIMDGRMSPMGCREDGYSPVGNGTRPRVRGGVGGGRGEGHGGKA